MNKNDDEKTFIDEFKNWKKSIPFTYELVMSHALHWPSPTFEWLSSTVRNDRKVEKSQILVSAITGVEKSHLLIADVYLPDKSQLDPKTPFGCFKQGSGCGKICPSRRMLVNGRVKKARKIDKMPGQFVVMTSNDVGKPKEKRQKEKKEATTKTDRGELMLFNMERDGWDVDWETEDMTGLEEEEARPVALFEHFVGKSFAVNNGAIQDYNEPVVAGFCKLEDAKIGIWNLEKASSLFVSHPVALLGDLEKDSNSTKVGEEVISWWESRSQILLAGDGDGYVSIWDLRCRDRRTRSVMRFRTHQQPLMSVSPCPLSAFVLCTTAKPVINEDNEIVKEVPPALWDIRNTARRLHTLGLPDVGRNVSKLRWSPHYSNLLAGSTNDTNVICVWDLNILKDRERMTNCKTFTFSRDVPELVFTHGGHSGMISDFDWHPDVGGVIASTALDNIVQIWKPLENLVPLTDPTATSNNGPEANVETPSKLLPKVSPEEPQIQSEKENCAEEHNTAITNDTAPDKDITTNNTEINNVTVNNSSSTSNNVANDDVNNDINTPNSAITEDNNNALNNAVIEDNNTNTSNKTVTEDSNTNTSNKTVTEDSNTNTSNNAVTENSSNTNTSNNAATEDNNTNISNSAVIEDNVTNTPNGIVTESDNITTNDAVTNNDINTNNIETDNRMVIDDNPITADNPSNPAFKQPPSTDSEMS